MADENGLLSASGRFQVKKSVRGFAWSPVDLIPRKPDVFSLTLLKSIFSKTLPGRLLSTGKRAVYGNDCAEVRRKTGGAIAAEKNRIILRGLGEFEIPPALAVVEQRLPIILSNPDLCGWGFQIARVFRSSWNAALQKWVVLHEK